MHRRALIVILAGTLALSGCGFKLRGKVDLPPSLAMVYVEGNDPVMVEDFKDALDFSGAQVVGSVGTATSAIVVESRYEREVRTQDARGVATGYVLRYAARARVLDPQGAETFKSPIIRLERNFDFDATQVLQKESEEDFLKEDMRKQLVQRIMRQLTSVASLDLREPPRRG